MIRFQGQYYDSETGLHHNRHRYYSPKTGRFTTVDPIGLAGGLNKYQYVPNPVNWVDPLGLSACPPDDKSASKLDHLAEQWKAENTPPINRNLSGVAGSVTGGSSSKLGKNLNEAMGRKRADSWQGYQPQHLIPSELRNHPILKIVGIDLDHESNGIFLPSTRNKPVGMISGKPRHTGSHPSYTNAVRQELNDMDRMLPIDQLEV